MDKRLKELEDRAEAQFQELKKCASFKEGLLLFTQLKYTDGKICERLSELYNALP